MIVVLAAEEFENLPIRVWNQLLHAGYPLTVLLHAPGPTALDPFLLRSAMGQALVCQTALAEAGHLLATVDQVAGQGQRRPDRRSSPTTASMPRVRWAGTPPPLKAA